jgi:5-methylcytosine-specific restriction endonuclease McrA
MAQDHDHGHECGKCGQTFDSEDDLKIHAREEHGMDA